MPTVYLNPNDLFHRFSMRRQFADQLAYAPVEDVKKEVYDAIITVMESKPYLSAKDVLAILQIRRSELYAGAVDA